MKSFGIDLSLTSTGVAMVDDGKLALHGTIKTTPDGKRPKDEIERLHGIVDQVVSFLKEFKPDIVVLEGIAFMAHNTTAIAQLAGLSYLVRSVLTKMTIPYLVVAPSSLKKFITGKGNSPKDTMMMEVYKQYKHSFLDNNESDAFSLAAVGMASGGSPIKKLTIPQTQVVSLISSQI